MAAGGMAAAVPSEARAWVLRAVPAEGLPEGLFTLVFADGVRRTLQVRMLRSGQYAGWTFFKFLSGPDNTTSYTTFAFVRRGSTEITMKRGYRTDSAPALALLGLLAATDRERLDMGLVYSRESGNCRICGRTLTVPESIEGGIGPECAARLGVVLPTPAQAVAGAGETFARTFNHSELERQVAAARAARPTRRMGGHEVATCNTCGQVTCDHTFLGRTQAMPAGGRARAQHTADDALARRYGEDAVHVFEDGYCRCGQDTCICQTCGKEICGSTATYIDGQNHCPHHTRRAAAV